MPGNSGSVRDEPFSMKSSATVKSLHLSMLKATQGGLCDHVVSRCSPP
jgi:hypothetical protein